MTKKSEPARPSAADDDEMEDAIEHLLALEGLEDEAEPTAAECAWADAVVERTRTEIDAMLQNVSHASPRPKA